MPTFRPYWRRQISSSLEDILFTSKDETSELQPTLMQL